MDVWDTHWNPLLGTTPAKDVTDVSLALAAQSDNTRLVVHYMQPHSPYIGDSKILPWGLDSNELEELDLKNIRESEEIPDAIDSEMLSRIFEEDLGARELEEEEMTLPTHTIKNRIETGDISTQELRAAYRDNLLYVLEEVKRLVERVNCSVIVTADHGEFLGEHNLFFHPQTHYPEGRQVPWFTVDESVIGTIPIEERFYEKAPFKHQDNSEENIEDKLAALGYIDTK
nr:sulfatase-like hydrolase/transferase [Haloglomus halophilum]